MCMFAYWWAVLVYGIIFGVVTNIVIKNKGYEENWFWWGFFFGVFALIVACTKPSKVAVAGVAQTPAVDSSIPQAIGLEKDYDTLYTIPERQYSIGSPIVINEGKLLKEKETGRIFAKCDFQIVTNKKIKAVFVSVLEYDVAGDFLGETKTQYLDLDRVDGVLFGSDNQIALSNIVTRKIEVKCTKVIFADDTKWEAENTWQQLPANTTLSMSLGLDLAEQYVLEVNNKAKFYPLEMDELWICSCGFANHHSNGRCVNCGAQKEAVFAVYNNRDELQRKLDARKSEELAAAQQKEAANKKRNKLLAIAAAIGVVILIISSIVSASKPGIKVVRMNTERGSNAVVSSISSLNRYFQVDFKVTGNFEGTIDLTHRVTYADGEVRTSSWRWDDVKSGDTCGVEWDNGFCRYDSGTAKIEIIETKTNKVIGTIKIKVK